MLSTQTRDSLASLALMLTIMVTILLLYSGFVHAAAARPGQCPGVCAASGASTAASTPASTIGASGRVEAHVPNEQNLQRCRMSPEHSRLLEQMLPHVSPLGSMTGSGGDELQAIRMDARMKKRISMLYPGNEQSSLITTQGNHQ